MEKFNYYENIKEYNEIYQKEVMPILTGFEDERIKLKNKKTLLSIFFNIKFAALLLIVFIVCFFAFFYFQFNNFFDENMDMNSAISLFLIGFAMAGCTGFSIVYMTICGLVEGKKNNAEKSFLSSIKTACLSKFLKIFGDIEWQMGGEPFIKREEIMKSKIGNVFYETQSQKQTFSNKKYADQFKGTYKNVAFKICEDGIYDDKALLEKYNRIYIMYEGNKKTNGLTIYKDIRNTKAGIKSTIIAVIILFLVMVAPVLTAVNSKGFIYGMDDILYLHLTVKTLFIGISVALWACFSYYIVYPFFKARDKKINLEDVKSQAKYTALSDDEVEGRYLLTPAFIERFNNLRMLFEADEISCAFFEDKLMIAINTKKNLFEIGSVDKSLHDPTVLSDFFNEIYSIYSIIDVLKLDERTGL